jgi:hypothetical protein
MLSENHNDCLLDAAFLLPSINIGITSAANIILETILWLLLAKRLSIGIEIANKITATKELNKNVFAGVSLANKCMVFPWYTEMSGGHLL